MRDRLLLLWFLWVLWFKRVWNKYWILWSLWDVWNIWDEWNDWDFWEEIHVFWNLWGYIWDIWNIWNIWGLRNNGRFRGHLWWRRGGKGGSDRIRLVAIPTQLSFNAGENESSQREKRLGDVNDNQIPHDDFLVCVDSGVVCASLDNLRDEGGNPSDEMHEGKDKQSSTIEDVDIPVPISALSETNRVDKLHCCHDSAAKEKQISVGPAAQWSSHDHQVANKHTGRNEGV